MNYRYLAEARHELDQHIDQYEQKEAGLGLEFLDEVVAGIGRIMTNPQAWTQIEPGIRRCLTDRFPYGIIYQYRHGTQEITLSPLCTPAKSPDTGGHGNFRESIQSIQIAMNTTHFDR